MLDLTEVDSDLRGFAGGFAVGHYGFLVPFKNREAEDVFSGKMVRFDTRTFDAASVTVSPFPGCWRGGGAGGGAREGKRNRRFSS